MTVPSPPTQKEQAYIDELRDDFRNLPALQDNAHSEQRWLDNMKLLSELVASEDPRNFLQWNIIKRTMEVGDADFLATELNFLRQNTNWSRWEKAIREVAVGAPTFSTIYPASSGNLIHHAYHVAQFEDKCGEQINNYECIFEFGGGYGGMYRLVHNLGFEGKYIIFDLPAFSALQRYYIKNIGLEVHTGESFAAAKSGVLLISDLDQLKNLLSDHMPVDNGMFIASWSLSETPMAFRALVLSLLTRFKAFLIAYQGQFEGHNNIQFFSQWKKSKPQYQWCNYQIEHIPNEFYRNNYYLMGQKILP